MNALPRDGAARAATAAIVVMGVAGCGKSTVGAAIAARLGVAFIEGDAHHPAGNVAKMNAGIPLTDDDRWPWLHDLAALLADGPAAGVTPPGSAGAVLACSALRRAYRDVLRSARPRVAFVHLALPYDVAVARISARPGHFMPASLADSQFAALEPLQDDEDGVTLDATAPGPDLIDAALQWFLQQPR